LEEPEADAGAAAAAAAAPDGGAAAVEALKPETILGAWSASCAGRDVYVPFFNYRSAIPTADSVSTGSDGLISILSILTSVSITTGLHQEYDVAL
jgi:hypothetical protein